MSGISKEISNALRFGCPKCGASSGEKCLGHTWHQKSLTFALEEMDSVHKERSDAAVEAVVKRLQKPILIDPIGQWLFSGYILEHHPRLNFVLSGFKSE